MVHAYVMVDAAGGTAQQVADAAREIGIVSEVHIITGPFDVLVEMNTTDVHSVLYTVTTELQTNENVGRTRSYISLDE